MLILLLIITVSCLLFSYFFTNNYISPPCICCTIMSVAAFIGVLNVEYWGYDIHFITVIAIGTGLLMFLSGYLFGNKYLKVGYPIHTYDNKRFVLSYTTMLIFIIAASWLVYEFYNEVNMNMLLLGIAVDDDAAMGKLHELGRAEQQYSWYVKYPLAVVKSITFVGIYCFFYNTIKFNFRIRDILFLVPIPYYFINSILRTERTSIFLLIIFSMMIYLLLNNENMKMKKLVFPAFLSILFIFIFGLFRAIKYDIYELQNTVDSICVYISGGIAALDKILNGDYGINSHVFGGMTFGWVYVWLSRIGLWNDEPTFSSYVPNSFVGIGDQFTTYGQGISTNVYTAFGGVYVDFGLAGILVIFLILGLIYGGFYNYINTRNSGYRYIIYAYAMYPLCMINFDNVFVLEFINPANWLSCIVGFFVYRFLYFRRK